MITPREEFPDVVAARIEEYGDEPQLCITYEYHYYGEDPPHGCVNHFEIEMFYVEEKEHQPFDGSECYWLIPGTSEDVIADWDFLP